MIRLADARFTWLLLCGLGLAALLYSWVFAWTHFSSPVWFDLWLWVADFEKWSAGHFTLHDLIKPHVSHRIATTRILLLVDSLYFHMTGHFVAVCNLFGLLVLGVMLGRLTMNGISRRAVWYLPVPVWAGFIAGTCQVENLILAFQVQFALVCCCAVGACWLFARACAAELPMRAAAASAVGGTAATLAAVFSMGSAILLLPSLGGLLWLRRAPRSVLAIFILCVFLVLAIEVPAYVARPAPASSSGFWLHTPIGLGLWVARLTFTADFLGSAATALPAAAPWVGYAGYGVLLALVAHPVWRRLRGGAAVNSAEGVLLAVALFAASCGPAGSLTPRILLGPNAALVDRYATMSLLFWAACGGIVLRRLDAAGIMPGWGRLLLVPVIAGLLYVVNLPAYVRKASALQRVIAADAELLTNNVALEGPVPEMLGGIPEIRDWVRFLHGARLNMFAPGQGPPADLLAALSAAPVGSLPVCRGSVDWATAIDSGAVLLAGWLADPDGRHTAPWIAVRDASGRIIGTARSLEERADLAAAGLKPPYDGLRAGFRDGGDGPRQLRLAGIFPGRTVKLCELAEAADIGGALVQPLSELRDLRPVSMVGAPGVGVGFVAGLRAMSPASPDFTPRGPMFSAGGGADRVGAVDFAVAGGGPADAVLMLPFWTSPTAGGKSVTFVLRDATRLTAPLGPWWGWGFWRAAVLPAALARLHGGAVRVEVRDAGGGALAVAAPMLATEQPGWSRFF